MKKILKQIIHVIRDHLTKYLPHKYEHYLLQKQVDVNSMLLAKLSIKQNQELQSVKSLFDVEFKVYSQWGEDGIIQYLINKIPIQNRIFIEFGVENYLESNTKFLLQNDNWDGLVIDSSEKNINAIKSSPIYWQYNLEAVCNFITKDNINSIISDAGFEGDIGLLSIDIDGNDYWVWDAINCISPRIIACEYNSVFGDEYPVTVPYDETFDRTQKHYSNLYFGSSLFALVHLAQKKGYSLVGSNSAGCNAFFVRDDLMNELDTVSVKNGYAQSKVRESFGNDGTRSYLSGKDRLEIIKELDLINVQTEKKIKVKDIIS